MEWAEFKRLAEANDRRKHGKYDDIITGLRPATPVRIEANGQNLTSQRYAIRKRARRLLTPTQFKRFMIVEHAGANWIGMEPEPARMDTPSPRPTALQAHRNRVGAANG